MRKYLNLTFFSELIISFFFILLLAHPRGYNIALGLMVISTIYALFIFVKHKKLNMPNIRIFGAFLVFYLLSFILSVLFSEGAFKELEHPIKSVLFFFVIVFLFNHPVREKFITYAIPLGAFMTGCIALVQRFYLHYEAAFESQMKIQAGDMAMSLGMFALVIGVHFLIQKKYWFALFSLLSAMLAVLASLLSGSRGGWIGVPVILAVIFFLYYKSFNKTTLASLSTAFLLLLAIVFSSSSIQSQVIGRVNAAIDDVEQYIVHHNTTSSNGARFNMWEGAIVAFKEKPLFGWGAKGMVEYRKELVNQGILNEANMWFTHAHNQYLDALSKRGIIGFISLLGIFFYPLYFFARSIRKNKENVDIKLWGTLGIVHILSAMSYCLTQGFFEHNSGNVFYFFVLCLFYGVLLKRR